MPAEPARSVAIAAICGTACFGVAGCGVETYRERAPDPSIAIRFVAEGERTAETTLPRWDTGENVAIAEGVIIEASHVDHVQLYETGEGERLVVIDLTDVGRTRLTEATTDASGQRLAIIAGGRVIATPTIREPLTEGEAYVRVPSARASEIFEAMGRAP